MSSAVQEIRTSEVVFRKDLYPRSTPDYELVQQYAEIVDELPPVILNQHNELLDGWHRWQAHRRAEREGIPAVYIDTANDSVAMLKAAGLNSRHGKPLGKQERREVARRLALQGLDLTLIAQELSVAPRTLRFWTQPDREKQRKERIAKVQEMTANGASRAEIQEETDYSDRRIDQIRADMKEQENCTFGKIAKSAVSDDPDPDLPEGIPDNVPGEGQTLANFDDGAPAIYDIWRFHDRGPYGAPHPGNSHGGIVERLLWMYTEPGDMVVDPFAGGGSTIDVCHKRGREFWAGDLNPIPERDDEIHRHDMTKGLPDLDWAQVSLAYLDPPYWRQVKGRYSTDEQDMSNMPLDQFHETLVDVIARLAEALRSGAHVALLIAPSREPEGEYRIFDHTLEISWKLRERGAPLRLARRIQCPYNTEQCTGSQVLWAKKNRKMLVLSRELVIWQAT